VRDGCRLLFQQADFNIVGEALSGEDAYAQYQKRKPQVVVMDLTMPGIGGLEAIRRIRSQSPEAGIVVFTMHDDPIIATRALQAGANCYVTKTSAPGDLVQAVKSAATGKFYLSRDIAQSVALSNLGMHKSPLEALTSREFEIFRSLVDGMGSAEIAAIFSLTPKSVTNYAIRIKQKLGARSLADLVRLAMDAGVVKQNVVPPAADPIEG
jgi:DNA-binding NarL/FixJ family response regulator